MPTDDDNEYKVSELIEDLGHGAVNKRASELMRQLIAACKLSGKKGKLSITLNVATSAAGLADIRADVKTTMPEPGLPGSVFFMTNDNGLVVEDPRQQSLPIPKTLPKHEGVINLSKGRES